MTLSWILLRSVSLLCLIEVSLCTPSLRLCWLSAQSIIGVGLHFPQKDESFWPPSCGEDQGVIVTFPGFYRGQLTFSASLRWVYNSLPEVFVGYLLSPRVEWVCTPHRKMSHWEHLCVMRTRESSWRYPGFYWCQLTFSASLRWVNNSLTEVLLVICSVHEWSESAPLTERWVIEDTFVWGGPGSHRDVTLDFIEVS